MANTKITTAVIKDDAITSAKIADDAVTGALIADDVALAGNPTTTTQSAGNNTTRIATTAFVTTAVANLVDSAPSALDTLNELAAAMGDDANFSTTITNSIATKLPLAGGTMTGAIVGTSASFTLADNSDNLSLVCTDTDDNSGPNLRMYRNSSSPADNYVLGQIDFEGKNDAAQDVRYGFISAKISDASDGTEDGQLRFFTIKGGTETQTMTLDSGNVLVGKTALEYDSNAGHIFRSDGLQSSIRDGGNAADFNRLSSDGEIIRISKDGTTVGSIGTNSGYMVIGSPVGTDAHLLIGNGLIHPATSTGAGNDASIDLGGSSNRFKDIYLSGGVNFSANANAAGMTSEVLNDYEEGAFTPTLYGGSTQVTTSNAVGEYTKVGNLVSVWGTMTRNDVSSHAGHLYISGLPFTQTAITYLVRQGMGHMWLDAGTNSDQVGMIYITGDTDLLGVVDHDIRSGRYIQIGALPQSRPIYFCASYTTSS